METGNPREWVRFEGNVVKQIEEMILEGEKNKETTSRTAKRIASTIMFEAENIVLIAIDQTRSLATSLDFGGDPSSTKMLEHFRRGCDIGTARVKRWAERQSKLIEEGA